jgi:hypothetical protein
MRRNVPQKLRFVERSSSSPGLSIFAVIFDSGFNLVSFVSRVLYRHERGTAKIGRAGLFRVTLDSELALRIGSSLEVALGDLLYDPTGQGRGSEAAGNLDVVTVIGRVSSMVERAKRHATIRGRSFRTSPVARPQF